METEEKDRTVTQNKQQWPYLTAFANQKLWPVNGNLVLMSREDWKHVLTAAFVKYMRSLGGEYALLVQTHVPENIALGFGLNKPENVDHFGTVMLGYHTSKFSEVIWPHWIVFLKCASDESGIKVPLSKKQIEQYEEFLGAING